MVNFLRCDKNGDGRLSEEEVKEVRIKPKKKILAFYSSSSCFILMNRSSST